MENKNELIRYTGKKYVYETKFKIPNKFEKIYE